MHSLLQLTARPPTPHTHVHTSTFSFTIFKTNSKALLTFGSKRGAPCMLIIQIYFYTHLARVCPRHCGENGAFSVNALLFAIDYCTLKVNTITLYFATLFSFLCTLNQRYFILYGIAKHSRISRHWQLGAVCGSYHMYECMPVALYEASVRLIRLAGLHGSGSVPNICR